MPEPPAISVPGGRPDMRLKPAVSYDFNLTVIAGLNALLWILALRGRRNPELLVTAILPIFVVVFGTVMAVAAPSVTKFT